VMIPKLNHQNEGRTGRSAACVYRSTATRLGAWNLGPSRRPICWLSRFFRPRLASSFWRSFWTAAP